MSTGTLARNLLRTQSLPLVGTRITNVHDMSKRKFSTAVKLTFCGEKKMSAEGKEINGTKRKRAEGSRFQSFSCESIPMPGFVLCLKGI